MKAKKSLGQHFLKSKTVLDAIVGEGDINSLDTVLEIGPGEGVLTSKLLASSGKVIAVEKDRRLIPFLEKKFEQEISDGKLKLIEGDILDMSKRHFDKVGKYKVVANIPYYITGQIIRMFLEAKNQPERMVLLVQKEVAERILAKDKKESLLSLSVKIFGTPKLVRAVGRGAFSPQPNVDSAILSIKDISRRSLDRDFEKKFFELIHAGFAHKRKQLLSNLCSLYTKDKLLEVFEKVGLDLKSRAEDVSLDKWLLLCKILQTAIQ